MKNIEIRNAALMNNVKLWELAYRMGMTDSTLSKKMRFEFSEAERERALRLIDEIAAEREEG